MIGTPVVSCLDLLVKKLALLLLVPALAGAVACSSDEDSPTATAPTPSIPESTGDRCDDPAGDLANDATSVGVGTEPSGIDITAASAELQDDDSLQFSFTTVGPITETPGTTFAIAQGTPYTALAFEVRATAGDAGTWDVRVITWDDQERSASVPVAPTVTGNTLSFSVPMGDPGVAGSLPPLGLYLEFGASAPVEGVGRVLDYCSSLTTAPTIG
jgi:hypothetical protein